MIAQTTRSFLRVVETVSRAIHSRQGLDNCLIHNGPFCGNNIVEDGEDCDCGFADDCMESCCVPRDSGRDTISGMCKLKVGNECSPSQGPCCAETCRYEPRHEKTNILHMRKQRRRSASR